MRGRLVETEPQHDDGDKAVALDLRHLAVDHGGVDQKRDRRQTVVAGLEPALILLANGQIGQKPFERLQHGAAFPSAIIGDPRKIARSIWGWQARPALVEWI